MAIPSEASEESAYIPLEDSPTSPSKRQRGPGRGGGDKPTVYVRWDYEHLIDQMIESIWEQPLWSAAFSPAPEPGGDVSNRPTSAGMTKRDIYRQISLELFSADDRYDVGNTRVLEALAVSVKNKLFKLHTTYNDCKETLGVLASLSEAEVVGLRKTNPEGANLWSQVLLTMPQFCRMRSIIARLPLAQPPPSVTRSLKRKQPSFDTAASPTATASSSGGSSSMYPSLTEMGGIFQAMSNTISRLESLVSNLQLTQEAEREGWLERELEEGVRRRSLEEEVLGLRKALEKVQGGREGCISCTHTRKAPEENLLEIAAGDGDLASPVVSSREAHAVLTEVDGYTSADADGETDDGELEVDGDMEEQ